MRALDAVARQNRLVWTENSGDENSITYLYLFTRLLTNLLVLALPEVLYLLLLQWYLQDIAEILQYGNYDIQNIQENTQAVIKMSYAITKMLIQHANNQLQSLYRPISPK